MNIDIKAIIDNKIEEMDKNNEVQKCIEEGIQKAIISGVKEALDGYSIKRIIEDKMKEQVSQNLESLDLHIHPKFCLARPSSPLLYSQIRYIQRSALSMAEQGASCRP